MPSPCRTAIEAFCDFADPIYRQIELNGIESQRLGSLRDALLPKLMSGEIDVSKVGLMQPNNHLSLMAIEMSDQSDLSSFEISAGILDELRPKSIGYADLLRITDPHALEHEVMAPACYFDKALAAGLIIVTGPYGPLHFYSEQVGDMRTLRSYDTVDGFGQFERRLGLVVEMRQQEICESRFDMKLGK